jgi:hypothetical protein
MINPLIYFGSRRRHANDCPFQVANSGKEGARQILSSSEHKINAIRFHQSTNTQCVVKFGMGWSVRALRIAKSPSIKGAFLFTIAAYG